MTKSEAPVGATKILLAPMAGVTDVPFRRQAQRFGARYTVSEMVAGEELARARADVVRRAAGADVIRPLVVQLAGREAQWMTRGAEIAEDAGADVIDINMGCPAKKVTTGLSGAALMREPDQALRLIEATVAGTRLPVTVKMRLGWDETALNAPEVARRAESAGAQMIVVHGRTRRQFYEGQADWTAVAETVRAVRIPVIVNGDIRNAADARAAMAASGAVGVMVGRGALGRPWLIGAMAAELDGGAPAGAPALAEQLESLLALIDDCLGFYGRELGLRIARKHIAASIDAIAPGDDAAAFRQARGAICRLACPNAVTTALERLFDLPQQRVAA